MKDLIKTSAILGAFVIALLFSCKKNDTKPSAPSIIGDWKLVSEYGYVGAGNIAPVADTMYKGTPADLYNFQPGGKLSWHQNGFSSDSASYNLKSRDTVIITYYPPNSPYYATGTQSYTINVLTANKMVLVLDGPPVVDTITFSR